MRPLPGVMVLMALVSEVFVESVQKAAEASGMPPVFVGFIVVALVSSVPEMAVAFSGARKNRLDLPDPETLWVSEREILAG